MDCHSAQNIPQQTAEIDWRISQKDNDDICLPLCLLFIICDIFSTRVHSLSIFPLGPVNDHWGGYY